ncbi:hypothetical protein Bca52824_066071 [Brassica carinata]|uniref:Uncharacterized protein n=1 Tax=Brassica carinata TaxID=52824 RepID=A0A8X7UBL5_BRACI|nr:hypothetical protein Bca52824_066071 [Brassica carinata]
MASNGTLASPSSQSDKLQDPPPVALDSSSAPLGVELPILRGCDTDIVAPPCTEAQASQIISASHLPTVEANVTSGSTTMASSVDVPVVDIDIILHQNESVVPSPSPSTQKVVTEQESLPATNLACEVPKICNQFSALDVLPVSSESKETITEKAATNSGLGLAQDQETPFVAPNVSTESPGNNVAAHSSILSTRIQQGIQTTPPSLITSTPILADFQSAQAATPSMESSPSTKIINNEDQNTYVVDPSTTTSDVNVFESPFRFSALVPNTLYLDFRIPTFVTVLGKLTWKSFAAAL